MKRERDPDVLYDEMVQREIDEREEQLEADKVARAQEADVVSQDHG